MLRSLCVVLVGCLSLPTTALASDRQRVVVLPLRAEGTVAVGWTPQLAQAVSDGLERGAFELVDGALDLSSDCDEAPCFVELADAASADYIVRAQVVGADRNYVVDIEVIAGSTGQVVAESHEVCELCGVTEVRELLADQSATLRTKIDDLVQAPPTFVVQTHPDGARVLIDGEVVGEAPVRTELIAGKHIARAELDGYVSVEREVLAVDGVESTLMLELPPLPKPGPNLRPLAWVGLGVGIGVVGAGATFFVLDGRPAPGGRCSGTNIDAAGNCRFRYDTLGEAIGITVGGVVITVAAAVALGLTKRRGRTVSVSPTGALRF